MPINKATHEALSRIGIREGWVQKPEEISEAFSTSGKSTVTVRDSAGKTIHAVPLTQIKDEMNSIAKEEEQKQALSQALKTRGKLQESSPEMQQQTTERATKLFKAICAFAGVMVLGISGGNDILVQSSGAANWLEDRSFAALTIRSIGSLKIGLALFLYPTIFPQP